MSTNKYVLFNNIEEAERFTSLYGGFVTSCLSGFEYRYYGDKVIGKIFVMIRNSKEDMQDIMKSIGVKKKKYNGRTIYVYQ